MLNLYTFHKSYLPYRWSTGTCSIHYQWGKNIKFLRICKPLCYSYGKRV